MIRQYIKYIFALLILLNISSIAYGNKPPAEVTRGQITTPTFLYWSVIGGSGSCRPSFDAPFYPDLGQGNDDGVYKLWIDGEGGTNSCGSQGNIKLEQVYAPAGTYVFRCTDVKSADDGHMPQS
jgi:hypothetical protein